MTEEQIEQDINSKGLNAPRITPSDIEEAIAGWEYTRLTGTLMVCVITLKNGFTVTGESACVSAENFDQEIGEEISFKNAREKIWLLEGYRLASDIQRGIEQ